MSHLRTLLAFTRIPGNAFSYGLRRLLNWSKGRPELPHEGKDALFDYLGTEASVWEDRARFLEGKYSLNALRDASTRALYRKNLYLLDILESSCEGLAPLETQAPALKALDVGAQDWHYVFALEKWLRHGACAQAPAIDLTGVELDGYGVYSDLHSRRDYAQAYAAQSGNPCVRYRVGDFLRMPAEERGSAGIDDKYDIITHFYPFVTRKALLLWGLPLRFFAPRRLVHESAERIRRGGRMLVFNHTSQEHEIFLDLTRTSGAFTLLSSGRAFSKLVDFHGQAADRRFSVWERK